MGDRDGGPGGKVARLRGRAAGREGPGAVEEVAVHRADPRFAVGRHRGHRDHLHPGKERCDLRGAQGAVTVDDVAQVVGGTGVGGVEKLLPG